MKQLTLFSLMLILCAGCKKDAGKQKEILLTEVSTDGEVNVRFQYSADNKLVRYETFNAGASTAYILFKYDANGFMSELSSYIMPGNMAAVRIFVQCNAEGKMIAATNYDLLGPTPNAPTSTATYSYNAQGNLIKVERRDENDEFVTALNISYFPDGNVKETQTFKEANDQLWLSARTIYSVPGGFYPKGVEPINNTLGPEVMASLFSESIQIYTYDQNGGMLTHKSRLMSGREFNEDGSLKKQVETSKSIKPLQPEEVFNKNYEYRLQ